MHTLHTSRKTSIPSVTLAAIVFFGLLLTEARPQNVQIAASLVNCTAADCAGQPIPAAELNLAASISTQTFNHWFWLQRIFWHWSDPSTIDPDAKSYYSQLIVETEAREMDVIGKTGTWIFPPAANAPIYEPTHECIPPRGSSEYDRLMSWRNQMHASIAREFPTVNKRIVGNEPQNEPYYCDRTRVRGTEVVPIVVDMLEGTYNLIKAQNPNATIILHALMGVNHGVPGAMEPKAFLELSMMRFTPGF
ncbi:MAG TPA: hypothetical protein PLP42_19995 [Acidobacteriota bacterium]|nr:hypothetical protein [Acidobacteriota bacterium]